MEAPRPSQQKEIRCSLPQSNAKCKIANYNSDLAVIICHPWGPLGGNMDNNVVRAVSRYFQSRKITTLRLNFAGSQIGRGWSEVDQVVEASEFLTSGLHDIIKSRISPPTQILLVGYSYGSLITSSASASIDKCIGFISIAPPFGAKQWLLMFNANHHERESKKKTDIPRYFIIGDSDNFTSSKTFQRTVESYPQQYTNHLLMKGVDHFFFGREIELLRNIEEWFNVVYDG